jgi:hypothetical protein
MIWCSLNLLFRIEASWRHSRPETSSFQWPCFKGGLQPHCGGLVNGLLLFLIRTPALYARALAQ